MRQSQRGSSGSTLVGCCAAAFPAGNQSVVHRGEKLAVHTISQFQDMGIAGIQSPVTAPVNINHHLLSPKVLAVDVEGGAAIAVTVTGQRLHTGRHL